MAALMNMARRYDRDLFAATTRALVRRGGWLAAKLPPLSRRSERFPAPVTALHMNALAATDIVGASGPASLIRANDNLVA